MPIISRYFELDASQIACWAGVCMPTTAESVLIAAAHSEQALRQAAAWRLLINLLQWVPIVTYLLLFAPPARSSQNIWMHSLSVGLSSMRRVALFVWGLALVGVFSCTEGFTLKERQSLGQLTTWSFLVALAGIGWNTCPQKVFGFGLVRMGLIFLVWAGCAAGLLWVLL
jgi:uncharacterized membrane protein YadS